MTVEEKACKYICDCTPCRIICTKAKCYIAGLEAGKPKWHDLRKNPNDLPQDKSNVLIFCGYHTFGFYETDEKVWLEFEYSNVYKNAENVIAWTEIPIFKEKV